ncbi:MAG: helix-turn-helix transcriptional regulator, partial [Acidimicrobiia bacterium]
MPKSRQESLIRPERFDYDDGERTGIHTHPTHQLVYAASGVLTLEIEDSRWVVPPLRAVWVPTGTRHELIAHGPTRTRPLYFDSSVDPPGIIGVTVITVSPLMRELIGELCRADPPAGEERGHLEDLIILQLDRMPANPLKLPTLKDPRLVPIAERLHEDPTIRHSLKEWGREVGASERTLVRLFEAETGSSFGQWRAQLRLHHALVLLGREEPVTTTAHLCGYHSASAFIERFRKTLGTTPGRYFDRTSG